MQTTAEFNPQVTFHKTQRFLHRGNRSRKVHFQRNRVLVVNEKFCAIEILDIPATNFLF